MTHQYHYIDRNSQILVLGIFVSAYLLMPKKAKYKQFHCLQPLYFSRFLTNHGGWQSLWWSGTWGCSKQMFGVAWSHSGPLLPTSLSSAEVWDIRYRKPLCKVSVGARWGWILPTRKNPFEPPVEERVSTHVKTLESYLFPCWLKDTFTWYPLINHGSCWLPKWCQIFLCLKLVLWVSLHWQLDVTIGCLLLLHNV